MNNILTNAEEQALRTHMQTKVRPLYKVSTIDKIVAKINDIRVGKAQDTDFINPITKILDWGTMLEAWGCYPRFVELK